MSKPEDTCVNDDGRPVQPPSEVLCKECLDGLDKKMHALMAGMTIVCDECGYNVQLGADGYCPLCREAAVEPEGEL